MVEERVSPLDVVEVLDVVTKGGVRVIPREVLLVIDELSAKRTEEAFCDGIVPAVALATHGRHELIARESGSMLGAGIGTSTVRRVDKA
jgi:hypothetical protein